MKKAFALVADASFFDQWPVASGQLPVVSSQQPAVSSQSSVKISIQRMVSEKFRPLTAGH
jgi:hypothetical protein